MEQEVLDQELKSLLMQVGAGALMCIGLFSFVYAAMWLAKSIITY